MCGSWGNARAPSGTSTSSICIDWRWTSRGTCLGHQKVPSFTTNGRDHGADQNQEENIYREKLNAYYGRSLADSAQFQDFRVRVNTDALFPVFLTVVVLSVGWVAVLGTSRH
jgi:hypothetical protein